MSKNFDDVFDKLADNISGINSNGERYGACDENGVSAWYFENDYNKYTDTEYNKEAVDFEVGGVMYLEHWFFVNEKHDSSVIGYSLMSDDGDIKFCIIGCKTDRVCSFETMYQYLTDSTYFIN